MSESSLLVSSRKTCSSSPMRLWALRGASFGAVAHELRGWSCSHALGTVSPKQQGTDNQLIKTNPGHKRIVPPDLSVTQEVWGLGDLYFSDLPRGLMVQPGLGSSARKTEFPEMLLPRPTIRNTFSVGG